MSDKIIFLSYRRDDSPGYVSRLETELEQVFGENSVFRDVRDISGGADWKKVIDENLRRAAVLLLVIGPRWDRIWCQRMDSGVDHVELELARARELGVPVIPVTLDGAAISPDTDLKSVSWLRDTQLYDISDKQRRWAGDFRGLVRTLESFDGLDRVKQPAAPAPVKKSRFKPIALTVICTILVLGLIGYFTEEEVVDIPGQSSADAVSANPPAATLMDKPSVPATPGDTSAAVAAWPDISGSWQGKDGTVYIVTQYEDGSFDILSPGYATGNGWFIQDMPNKLEFEMHGIGYGELSVSTTGNRLQGWMVDGNGQTVYDTLVKIPLQ